MVRNCYVNIDNQDVVFYKMSGVAYLSVESGAEMSVKTVSNEDPLHSQICSSDFHETLKVLQTFSLDNGCRNGSEGPQRSYLYHIRHNLRPHKMVGTVVKIVVIVCLFPSFRVFSRKLSSVIKPHYNPLPDIYLGTTPFLFCSLFQSKDLSCVRPRHCLG